MVRAGSPDWEAKKVTEEAATAELKARWERSIMPLVMETRQRMLSAGATSAEVEAEIKGLLKKRAERDASVYWVDKGADWLSQVTGGAARAGMTYAGVSSGMLNQAKRLTPSEY